MRSIGISDSGFQFDIPMLIQYECIAISQAGSYKPALETIIVDLTYVEYTSVKVEAEEMSR